MKDPETDFVVMREIRYVIVSDLHLASSNSILTRLTADRQSTLPHEPSDLLRQFVTCLQDVLSKDEGNAPVTLILNGDILELALAGLNEAAMTFQGFIELLMDSTIGKQRIERRIFYSAGNHDHHIWNTARETQYVENYLREVSPTEALAPEYYVTNMFNDEALVPVPAYFLNALFRRVPSLSDLHFTSVYPNFALLNADKTKCVVMHHGHYIESIYSLMGHLKDIFFPGRNGPAKIWDLEAENGAWVDFFWSTLGRSGEVGTGVGLIFDKLQDEMQVNALLHNLALAIEPSLPLQRWPFLTGIKTELVTEVLKWTLGRLARREVHDASTELTENAERGLKRYLERYVLAEIKRGNRDAIPANVTFLFGHTHKPFERATRYEGYHAPVRLLNSGGWVVDSLYTNKLHGGAILFVDEDLNAASVRMYQESDSPDEYRVRVTAASTSGNPLFERLEGLIKPDEEPWKSFSQLAYQAVCDHRENLRFNIARADTRGKTLM